MTDLPAGPELDRLVAPLMGDRLKSRILRHKDGSAVYFLGDWSPSTNIAHAWEVLIEMRRRPANPVKPALWWNMTAGAYACVEGYGMPLSRIMHDCPEQLPHAICLAALEAVGAGKTE